MDGIKNLFLCLRWPVPLACHLFKSFSSRHATLLLGSSSLEIPGLYGCSRHEMCRVTRLMCAWAAGGVVTGNPDQAARILRAVLTGRGKSLWCLILVRHLLVGTVSWVILSRLVPESLQLLNPPSERQALMMSSRISFVAGISVLLFSIRKCMQVRG